MRHSHHHPLYILYNKKKERYSGKLAKNNKKEEIVSRMISDCWGCNPSAIGGEIAEMCGEHMQEYGLKTGNVYICRTCGTITSAISIGRMPESVRQLGIDRDWGMLYLKARCNTCKRLRRPLDGDRFNRIYILNIEE
jgi:hypothetical protein